MGIYYSFPSVFGKLLEVGKNILRKVWLNRKNMPEELKKN